jgi:serine/threonine-protein kinase
VTSTAPIRTQGLRASLPLPTAAKRESVQPSSVVLEGKYRLLDELGRGSMGTVFLAEDTLLRRKVAVKFLLPELAHSAECAVRFKREAIAMASIRNANVAQIYSYGEDRGTPYFVMEYLEGETVESAIDAYNRRGFFMPVADAVDIIIQTLYGVAAIHKADAVHRDIKPGNIMLEADTSRAILMDFGLVRDIKVEDDMRTLAGTPAYIAPELVEGRDGASRSQLADIYSIGATFYELITGSIPFNGNNWVEILQKHMAEIPEFPSTRRPGLPEAVDDIIMRAMSKDPRERYQSCESFLDDLTALAGKVDDKEPRTPSRAPASGTGTKRAPSGGYRRSPKHRSSSDPSRGFRNTPSFTRGRLVVVDQDRDFRSKVYDAAKAAVPGCRVHSATDGPMAMELIRTVDPHVLVINLALPEMSGFEIIASVLGDEAFRQMTIIAVSDNSGTKDAQLLRGMGVRHFWSKPIDIEALLEVIIPELEKPLSRTSGQPQSAF